MSLLLVIFILEIEGKGDSDKSSSFVSNSNLSHVIWILRLVGNFMNIESWVLGTHQQSRFSCSLWFLPYVSGMTINKEEIIFGCTGSLLQCTSLSLIAEHGLLLLWSTGFRRAGFSKLWFLGLTALQHVESSQTRDGTHVPCIGRQILSHWTTREVWSTFLKDDFGELRGYNFGVWN